MRPIELLETELKKWQSTRQHSVDSMEKGDIDIDLHEQHLRNLDPMIVKYILAINILKEYT